MKNMAVLIDTNVLLNYITNSTIFSVASASQTEIIDAICKDWLKYSEKRTD